MYTKAFEAALDHAMLYEVGGFWDIKHPAVERGLVDSAPNRRAVGYVNDPLDTGGETKFGVAKNANPDLNIRTLTWAQAKDVYYKRYWVPAGCAGLPGRIAVLHFDGAVNHGVSRAGIFLQKAVGTTQDGKVGPATQAKAKSLDEYAVCDDILKQREAFYRAIVAAKPNQARFLGGWLRRIHEMRDYVMSRARTFQQ